MLIAKIKSLIGLLTESVFFIFFELLNKDHGNCQRKYYCTRNNQTQCVVLWFHLNGGRCLSGAKLFINAHSQICIR